MAEQSQAVDCTEQHLTPLQQHQNFSMTLCRVASGERKHSMAAAPPKPPGIARDGVHDWVQLAAEKYADGSYKLWKQPPPGVAGLPEELDGPNSYPQARPHQTLLNPPFVICLHGFLVSHRNFVPLWQARRGGGYCSCAGEAPCLNIFELAIAPLLHILHEWHQI